MRIVHIIPSLIGGGAERIALDICNELSTRTDTEVLLILFRPDIEYPYKSPKLKIKTIPAAVRLSVFRKPVSQISDLQKEIESFKPQIIHTHLFEAEIVSRTLAYPTALWFSHGHDKMVQLESPAIQMFFEKKRFTNWWERHYLLQRYLRNGGNYFVAISRDVENFFNRVLPSVLRKVVFLPNAIRLERFLRPAEIQREQSAVLRLINVGSFIPVKNQVFLVDVVHCLVSKGIKVELTFLGDGPTRPLVEQKVKNLNLAEHIKFAGKTPEVEKHLWKADVYVHAATSEGFGLVLIEAMASGLPVVSLDGLGNRDIIKQGINGFIEAPDTEAYAARLIQLMNDRSLYEGLQQNGLRTAQTYDIKNYVDRLLQLYNQAIEARHLQSSR